jgi:hypothetical protein
MMSKIALECLILIPIGLLLGFLLVHFLVILLLKKANGVLMV